MSGRANASMLRRCFMSLEITGFDLARGIRAKSRGALNEFLRALVEISCELGHEGFNDFQAFFSFAMAQIKRRQEAQDPGSGWNRQQAGTMQQAGNSDGWAFRVIAGEVRNLWRQFQSQH